jgi:DNA invertase Pin-like site-specific DNA recombinase
MVGKSEVPEQRPLAAAQYIRMSTDHQQYSTQNQITTIERFAAAHEMRVVRSFIDAGKSGLNLAGRDALVELIETVKKGNADFDVILVYDVSRWGRFQDADESAYHEYVCKRAGIRVIYCAEPFDNDDSTQSNIIKALKRTMAGEYSRELSVKVFAGQCRLIELGFRQGGPAGFGLRRQLIDQNGIPKVILERGQCKSLQTDRVILIPGPPEEIALVQEIYDLFTHSGKTEAQIATLLNLRGCQADFQRPWTRGIVHQILINPKYIGANVYNRHSFKLKKKRVINPKEMWLWRDRAFEAIITSDQFNLAQAIITRRHQHYTDEQMLDKLRNLLAQAGRLSGILIDEMDDLPSSSIYRTRFKSLVRAYKLIGYTPARDYSYLELNQALREAYDQRCAAIIDQLRLSGATVERDDRTDLLTINSEFTASLILARCRQTPAGSYRWLLRLEHSLSPDITIAARLTPGNGSVLDYYLLPNIDILEDQLRLAEENGVFLDVYRFEDLTFFFAIARRTTIGEIA